MLVMILSGASFPYGMTCVNQLSDTFNAKYQWESTFDRNFHQTLIVSSFFFGMTIGATLAGKILKIGRRRTIFLCCVIGMLGVAITLIEKFNMMVLGRVIFGFACGIQTVATPRYIEEYVPV